MFMTIAKKKFLQDALGKNFNKTARPSSKELFENITLTYNEGHLNGAKFYGKKIFVLTRDKKSFTLSTNRQVAATFVMNHVRRTR